MIKSLCEYTEAEKASLVYIIFYNPERGIWISQKLPPREEN